jgi:hypothetical protein
MSLAYYQLRIAAKIKYQDFSQDNSVNKVIGYGMYSQD